ncbi:hypothetical protein X975_01022, partial [Stegodyphus mimosarum]
MPDSVCNILIVSDEDTKKLALMADRIIEMQLKQELYCTSSIVSPGADAITELQQQIASLVKKLKKLSVTRNSSPRSRNSGRSSNDQSRSRNCYNTNGKYCHFHFHFREKRFPDRCMEKQLAGKPKSAVELVAGSAAVNKENC